MITDAVVAELAPDVGVRAACRAVATPQANYYRRHRRSPAPPRPAPIPPRKRPQPRALSHVERQAIFDQLHSDRFVDASPTEVWATLLDEGGYLGSLSPPSTGCCARLGRAVSGAGRQPIPPA